MLSAIKQRVRDFAMPAAAKRARRLDARGVPELDPGIDRVLDEGAAWLGRAQDHSASADGGASRDYSLLRQGWATSYPETTGYIVPTLLDYGVLRNDEISRRRALKMLEWLRSIQMDCGGFQGGRIDASPAVPVTFNTGQILMGLAAGVREFDGFEPAARRAADWLVQTQDDDGCWRKHATPFAKPGEKVYETHVSWGLFEAERVLPGSGYGEAGLAQVRWALTWQADNGWLDRCCLTDPTQPLTHTLGYALRGILEAYLLSRQEHYLAASLRLADGLLGALDDNGRLPGRLRSDWSPAVSWACLTGIVQIAHCWLEIYRQTGNARYRDAGFLANRFVRRTTDVDGPAEIRGGVKGAFPIQGDYGAYEYLNWAVKFSMDANMLERKIRIDEGLDLP